MQVTCIHTNLYRGGACYDRHGAHIALKGHIDMLAIPDKARRLFRTICPLRVEGEDDLIIAIAANDSAVTLHKSGNLVCHANMQYWHNSPSFLNRYFPSA